MQICFFFSLQIKRIHLKKTQIQFNSIHFLLDAFQFKSNSIPLTPIQSVRIQFKSIQFNLNLISNTMQFISISSKFDWISDEIHLVMYIYLYLCGYIYTYFYIYIILQTQVLVDAYSCSDIYIYIYRCVDIII